MTEYDVNQMFAEAIHRIGFDPVFRYLEAAARRVGWPIPRKHRRQVITEPSGRPWSRCDQRRPD